MWWWIITWFMQCNTMQFVTMATTGNAQDFGDLSRTIDSGSGTTMEWNKSSYMLEVMELHHSQGI